MIRDPDLEQMYLALVSMAERRNNIELLDYIKMFEEFLVVCSSTLSQDDVSGMISKKQKFRTERLGSANPQCAFFF